MAAAFCWPSSVRNSGQRAVDVADVLGGHGEEITEHETVPAAADADDLDPHAGGRAHNGADGRVHAGGVSPAGEYADAFDRFHMYTFLSVPGGSYSLH